MAIYSLQCKIIGRGGRGGTVSLRSVVAAAAYRAGACLYGKKDSCSYDFTRKKGVVHSEILLSQGAPGRYHNRETLWNEVEAAERRHDAQYCRELVIAMPMELSHEKNVELARRYIQKHFVSRGMCADISLHDPHGNNSNPHVHVMLTMRDLQHGRWGVKNRSWNSKEALENWREQWAETCNDFLAERGIDVRIDHRTLKAQGIDRRPTVHLGVKAAALERKGVRTEKGNINRSVNAYNTAIDCGIEPDGILSAVGELWQRAANQRRRNEVAPAPMPAADVRQRMGQGRDSRGGDVQRRTYTLPSNVVRQGCDPAPEKDKESALRGDVPEEKRPPQRGQEAGSSSEVLRQPAREQSEHVGLWQRLTAWFGGDKSPRMNRGEAMYDIKVMTSALNRMAEEGISNYDALADKVSRVADRVTAERSELLAVSRQLGQVKACGKLCAEAEQLRLRLKQAEQLHGAALRCQANRKYAEEYAGKVFFRDNYYKKYADKIETFTRASEQLTAAGFSDSIAPDQLGQMVQSVKQQLKTAHSKYLWLAGQLDAVGCPAQPTGQQLEQLADRLEQSKQRAKDVAAQMQKELWKWQQLKKQVDNVLDGKRAREPNSRKDQDKNKDAPSR